MKIKIDDQDYELDLVKAKELGLITKSISIKSGQVYDNGVIKILLISDCSNSDTIIITGANKNPFEMFAGNPVKKDRIIQLIKSGQWNYVGELGKDVSLESFKA